MTEIWIIDEDPASEQIDQVIAEAYADGQDAIGQMAAVWAAGLMEVGGPITEKGAELPIRTDQ